MEISPPCHFFELLKEYSMSYDFTKSNLYNAIHEFLEEHSMSELLEILRYCVEEKEQKS